MMGLGFEASPPVSLDALQACSKSRIGRIDTTASFIAVTRGGKK